MFVSLVRDIRMAIPDSLPPIGSNAILCTMRVGEGLLRQHTGLSITKYVMFEVTV